MSRSGVEVRQDITAGVLRKKARAEKDVLAASRILGIANILDGMDRVSAAKAAGMDRQTLRDWVHRYNRDGLAGLYNRPKGRPERRLSQGQEKEIADLVSKAPEGNLVRWRCVDIKAEIESKLAEGPLDARRLEPRFSAHAALHPELPMSNSTSFLSVSMASLAPTSLCVGRNTINGFKEE